MSFDILIPLGGCCHTTFITKLYGYNTGNSPYSWTSCPNFNDIITSLTKFPTDIDYTEEKYNKKKMVHYLGTDMWLPHHGDDYIQVQERRYNRLIDVIKSNKNILFIRTNHTADRLDITMLDEFDRVLKGINANIKYKILVVDEYTPREKYTLKEHHNLIYEVFVSESVYKGPSGLDMIMYCDPSAHSYLLDFWDRLLKDKIARVE
jgi:hypothetical protein